MRKATTVLVSFLISSALAVAQSALQPVHSAVQPSHVSINNGLTITANGRKLMITPGSAWVNDKLATLKEAVTISVPDCPNGFVTDEKSHIYAIGKGEPPCMPSKGHATDQDYAPLVNEVPAAAMKVKDGPGKNAHFYKNGIDYLTDLGTGIVYRTAASAIKEGQAVWLDYVYFQRRLDSIAIDDQGKLVLLVGDLSRSAPQPPQAPPNMLVVAHVVAGPGNAPIQEADVIPIACSDCKFFNSSHDQNRKALAKTIARLKTGEPVRIAFWGDSITAGCDATNADRGYANVFLSQLMRQFPNAKVTAKNCGVGGSTTTSRFDKMDKEVMSFKPNLVMIEFVNDVRFTQLELTHNYEQIAKKLKDAGVEVILINPHMPAPVLVGAKEWKAIPGQYYYTFARQFTKENDWALADVETRWEALAREGLRPDLMLVDNLVHINDRGHAIYAETILSCLL